MLLRERTGQQRGADCEVGLPGHAMLGEDDRVLWGLGRHVHLRQSERSEDELYLELEFELDRRWQ